MSQELTGIWHSGMLLNYWPPHLVKMLKNPGYHTVTFNSSARRRKARHVAAFPLKGEDKISHSLPILNCCTK